MDKKPTNKPLTAKQFYSKYAQHIDIRGRDGNAAENAKSIMEKGFKRGLNVNAYPPYRGGEPGDVTSKRFKPQLGDTVYLAPRHAWKDTPNGMQIQDGWKPESHEVITVTEPNQSMHEAYLAKLNKKARGGSIMKKPTTIDQMSAELRAKGKAKFLVGSKVKQRVFHGTNKDITAFDSSKAGENYGMDKEGMFFTSNPQTASIYAAQDPYEFGGTRSGANVMPVHLSLKNPLIINSKNASKLGLDTNFNEGTLFDNNRQKIMYLAKKGGHDGVQIGEDFIAFKPHQIKSATGNRGTYDINDPDITKAKGGKVSEPKSTVKAYKLFRVHEKHPGKLFPLFVDANTPVEMGKWIDAKEGEMSNGKVKSKIGSLAYRPGWHAGDLPIATHIGEKSHPSLTAPDQRPANHAWAEVEMPNDVDWQSEADKRGTNAQGKIVPVKAHITDQIPKGGHYRYKTNPNMTGNWLIGGSMKVNKVLTDKEVEKINKAAGLDDLPRAQAFKKKQYGFASGGCVAPEEWKSEEHINHGVIHKADGGSIHKNDSAFIGYLSPDGKFESYPESVAKANDYHHSYTIKDLDAYDKEGGLTFVRMGGEPILSIKGSPAMDPYHPKSSPMIADLARRVIKAGAHPDMPIKIEHMGFKKHEAPYQDKHIGTLREWSMRHAIKHKADGGTIQGNKMDAPTIAQMRFQINQRKNPDYVSNIGIDQAVDMMPKSYSSPERNKVLPVGGIDQDQLKAGQQMMPAQTQSPPDQDGQPNSAPEGADGEQPGGLEGQAPQGQTPPMGNLLSMTPQGQQMQAMAPTGMATGGSAYSKAPHSLMGFKKEGQQKAYDESNYKHIAYVKVHHGDDHHVDAIKGLNHPHAMARARINWPSASHIEHISEQEARKIDSRLATGGKINSKQMAAIKAKMMMMKSRPKHLAKGGSVDAPYSETSNPGRILFHGKGHGQTKGIVVPRHMWEGSEGVYEKGEKKGKPFKNEGMRDLNQARAEVYGSENRDPLTIGQVNRTHKNVLEEHFAKPLKEQLAAENEALGRLRKAKHIGKNANTLDKSEKLDTVKHELDEEGRSHVGFASKGVAGHSLYTSGHGNNKEHHIINTCPGQTVGCGGGHDANGIIDTMKGTCFAPNAESQYVNASVRRAAHEQAKHDPKMTRDWILAHTGSLRKVSETADKNNERTLFRPNVVDETDTSSRHVIRHLNKQRKIKDKPPIIANSYGKTNELHDPENGYYVTHSNVGPKVKHGKSIAENIARDKQRVRSTVTATEASGKDFQNEEGNKTPPKGSYMVTDVKRKSPMQREMEKHIKHIKYWSTGKPVNELSKEEKGEEEEGHFDGNGNATTEDKAHYGHMTFDGKRYDYQKQHVLHPRLVNVPERKKNNKTKKMETVEHMIPTDSRFMDESFLPKKRFKTKNGKVAGHILMTTPTESTSNVGHETSFTHHVGEHNIDYAKRNKGEYEVDSPMHQVMAEGKEYVKPEPINIVRKVKAVKKADGGSITFTPHDYDDDFNAFPERNYIAQHHLANRVGIEDESEVHPSLLQRQKD